MERNEQRKLIRDEFEFYLSNVAKSSRITANGYNLQRSAVVSYLLFIEPVKLFDYAPQKWQHIESMYDIIIPEKVEEILNSLMSDSDFRMRDKDNNQGWRSGAIMHYSCFVKARAFFNQNKESVIEEKQPVAQEPELNDMLSKLLTKYREELPTFWEDEEYKWIAVSHFQDNWDIEADDFSAMFTEATKKHQNLLTSAMYYPIGMIQGFAEFDEDRTREMFRVLFDESKDLSERIKFFWDEADDMREKGDDKWINHYQDLRAISVYLTFMYPDKYFIYKNTELRNCVKTLGDDFSFPWKTTPEFYSKVLDYCEGLRSRIADDKATCKLLDELIKSNPECYEDKHRNIATVDFIYYIGKRLKDIPSEGTANEDDDTFIEPDENSRYWIYAPGEGARMWQLCQDEGIMVLGWGEIGDYSQYHSREKLTADMQDIYNLHDKNFMNSSLAVWQFLKDMKPGDVIFVKKGRGKVLGRGVVQGNYTYSEEVDEEYRSTR